MRMNMFIYSDNIYTHKNSGIEGETIKQRFRLSGFRKLRSKCVLSTGNKLGLQWYTLIEYTKMEKHPAVA